MSLYFASDRSRLHDQLIHFTRAECLKNLDLGAFSAEFIPEKFSTMYLGF